MSDTDDRSKEKVVAPGEDIVAATVANFRESLSCAVSAVDKVVIDLGNVEVIDAKGIEVIVAAHNSMKKAGGMVAVTNVVPGIHKLFKTMRLDEHFEIQAKN
jgi:anti-anti-sigma factor